MRQTEGAVDTRTRILDAAERLAQRRGFNGFSYADIASEIGITKASLHYHFASKAELGRAVLARYAERFMAELASFDSQLQDARQRLVSYANLYGTVLEQDRFCLCGMLAAEYETLPPVMRAGIIAFFDQNEAWLAGVLELGRKQGSVHFAGSPGDAARMVVYALEGALLVARPYREVSRFRTAVLELLAGLTQRPSSK